MKITIQYVSESGKVREKTFPSQEALEKWSEKNQVQILRYSSEQQFASVRNDAGDVVRGDSLNTAAGQEQAKRYPEIN